MYRHAIGFFCQKLNMTPDKLIFSLRAWWSAWKEHPDFVSFYTADQWGYQPSLSVFSPVVCGVFKHDRGVYNKTESFIHSPLPDVLNNISWGEDKLGEFVGIRAISDELEIGRYRLRYTSYSLNGAGKAYWARKRLKEALPNDLRPLVNGARRCKRLKLQGEYKTKKERFFSGDGKFGNSRERLDKLKLYMSNEDFWLCALGRIHPEDVHSKFYQMTMF